MAIDTKPNLNSYKFEQCVNDILSLSGCTDVYGEFEIKSGGTLSILPNYGLGKVLTSDSNGVGMWELPNITGATNGLTKLNRQIKLGGTLTGSTIIDTNNTNLSICSSTYPNRSIIYNQTGDILNLSWSDTGNACISNVNFTSDCILLQSKYPGGGCYAGIVLVQGNNRICFDSAGAYRTYHNTCGLTYTADYSSNANARWIPDAAWVTGKTSQAIITANNGLAKVGTNVVLGGALTGNTTISGNYTLSICSGAKINTNCGYQISGTTILQTPKSYNSIYLGNISTPSSTAANIIAIGNTLFNANTTGNINIGIGWNVLCSNTIGYYNVGIGVGVLSKGSGAYNNYGIGAYALQCNNAYNNIAIGTIALCSNIDGFYNIAIGNASLVNATCSNNIGIGNETLCLTNTGIGNVAIGTQSMVNNTTGSYNYAAGMYSLFCNTIGCSNFGLGFNSGYLNSTGCNNVFIGTCAGYNETGSNKLHVAQSAICDLIYGDFTTNFVQLPTLKLCNTPTTGVCTDSVLVWNSTDKCVKILPYSSGGTGGSLSEYTITGNSSNTGFTINHSKNKQFVGVEVVRNSSPYPTVYTNVYRTNANCICITFDIAPTSGLEFKILITS